MDHTAPIEPPFGLEWGESQQNTITWANSNNFPIKTGKDLLQRDVIEVDGPFPNAEFDRLRFYFINNQLMEVEIQFHYTSTSPEKNAELEAITEALAIKNLIDSKLGKGQLVRNEKNNKNQREWSFIQQIWTDEEHAVWLSIFLARTPQGESLAITSLHYRWEKRILEETKKESNK